MEEAKEKYESYISIRPKNPIDNKAEEIYVKSSKEGVEFLYSHKTNLSANQIKTEIISFEKYKNIIDNFQKSGGLETNKIDKATYNHRRQNLQEILQN
jgi:hypothetical protein